MEITLQGVKDLLAPAISNPDIQEEAIVVACGRLGALQCPQHQVRKKIQLADGTNSHPEPRRQTALHPFQHRVLDHVENRGDVDGLTAQVFVESDQRVTFRIPSGRTRLQLPPLSSLRGGSP